MKKILKFSYTDLGANKVSAIAIGTGDSGETNWLVGRPGGLDLLMESGSSDNCLKIRVLFPHDPKTTSI